MECSHISAAEVPVAACSQGVRNGRLPGNNCRIPVLGAEGHSDTLNPKPQKASKPPKPKERTEAASPSLARTAEDMPGPGTIGAFVIRYCNIGALIIRIGFGGILYCHSN